ncbi:MAG: DUF3098 domain-containing protein [Phaeodactylibacter sp.]|nr:DUF3098 domain-containing protein [Phaeodactylibacter sp.]
MSSKQPPKKKVVVTTQPKSTPATGNKRTKATVASKARTSRERVQSTPALVFKKENYYMMIGGVVLIALGMALMTGGQMPDPDTWDESIIYSTRRTVLAPAVIIAGLVLQIVAIFYKPSES